MRVDNPAPVVFRKRGTRRPRPEPVDEDDDRREQFDSAEVYEHLQNISDPEHPYTLEQVLRRARSECWCCRRWVAFGPAAPR